MPLVSICIPTYNHAIFLTDSLRSAAAQTHPDIEIVVLDNASEDDTEAVVTRFASEDPRIRYLRHPKNIGLTANLNACIEFARGTYIKILCADDTLNSKCVSAMAAILEHQADVSLVGCARCVTDASLSPLHIARARKCSEQISGQAMIAECFFFGNRIGEPTAVMFRRAEALRGFIPSYRQIVDMEMWFHLLSKGGYFALSEALCSIRTHEGQATWENDLDGRIVDDRKRLYAELASSVGKSASALRRYVWDFRMAYAVVRSIGAGNSSIKLPVTEVFFPRVFTVLTYPLVKCGVALGLNRVWRTGTA